MLRQRVRSRLFGGGSCVFYPILPHLMQTIVYIDAFNLYYVG